MNEISSIFYWYVKFIQYIFASGGILIHISIWRTKIILIHLRAIRMKNHWRWSFDPLCSIFNFHFWSTYIFWIGIQINIYRMSIYTVYESDVKSNFWSTFCSGQIYNCSISVNDSKDTMIENGSKSGASILLDIECWTETLYLKPR